MEASDWCPCQHARWCFGQPRQRHHSHAIDRERVAEAEETGNLALSCHPDLGPLERALGLGVEEDTSNADCGEQVGKAAKGGYSPPLPRNSPSASVVTVVSTQYLPASEAGILTGLVKAVEAHLEQVRRRGLHSWGCDVRVASPER